MIQYLKKAVFLDRDGVIINTKIKNGKAVAIGNKREIKILDGVVEAVNSLFAAEFELVVVTNQPDIKNGITSQEAIEEIHQEISEITGLRHFYVCPHIDSDFCVCRKPLPGLLISAAKNIGIDPKQSFLVGDRWRDIEAGQRFGCENFFIDYGYAEGKPSQPFTKVRSLKDAAKLILKKADL